MATTPQLDMALIDGYLEVLDIDVIEQMLALYIQQSALYLVAIDSTVAALDQQAWQEQCHKMKGSAASVGLIQVHQKLIAIEKSTEDWATKAEHVRSLAEINQTAISAFQQWFAEQ